MLRRTSAARAPTSWPRISAVPEVGLSSVVRIFMVVLLPAPLGPRKPKTSPASTSKVTPSTALIPPLYTLTRSRTDMVDMPETTASN